jgi:hypothetical protein
MRSQMVRPEAKEEAWEWKRAASRPLTVLIRP